MKVWQPFTWIRLSNITVADGVEWTQDRAWADVTRRVCRVSSFRVIVNLKKGDQADFLREVLVTRAGVKGA